MKVRYEVLPFLIAVVVIGIILISLFVGLELKGAAKISVGLTILFSIILLIFFRDPDRQCSVDSNAVLSGADGVVMEICKEEEEHYLKTCSMRVSIFLSLWDVHVTRYPISGTVREAGYLSGKTVPAYKSISSNVNRKSTILIKSDQSLCLVRQIVGLVARRAVHWAKIGQQVEKGTRMGMMKFGSRLDILMPAADITVVVKCGEHVKAGKSVIARLNVSHNEKV